MHPDQEYKNFDEVFADSANMQKFDFDPAAWDDMEAMLDKRDKKRVLLWWFFGVLIIGVATLFLLPYISPTPRYTSSTDQATSIKNDINTVNLKSTTTNNTILNSEKDDIPTEKSTPSANQTRSKNTPLNNATATRESETRTFLGDNTKRHISKIQPPAQKSNNSLPVNETHSKSSVPFHQQQIEATNPSPERAASPPITTSIKATNLKAILPLGLGPLKPFATNTIFDLPQLAAMQPEAQEASNDARKWSFSIHAAPEWSAFSSSDKPTLGWRTGFDISYNLSPRWSVHTGVGLSKKHCSGDGNSFTKIGGWEANIAPQSVEAKCHIIDIPVLASYTLSSTAKSRFYIQAGLSNYFMNSEWYGFNYRDEDRAALTSLGKTPLDEINLSTSTNTHWVGSGHISVGYSHNIADRWSVQIAPYFQVPISGIGEGNTKIYSGGIKAALTFN